MQANVHDQIPSSKGKVLAGKPFAGAATTTFLNFSLFPVPRARGPQAQAVAQIILLCRGQSFGVNAPGGGGGFFMFAGWPSIRPATRISNSATGCSAKRHTKEAGAKTQAPPMKGPFRWPRTELGSWRKQNVTSFNRSPRISSRTLQARSKCRKRPSPGGKATT